MSLTEWKALAKGPTLLVAPLGWDCFGLDEDETLFPVRKHLMNPVKRSLDQPRRLTVIRVRTVG